MSVNKVILLGNVGKTPHVKTFDNGNKVAMFTVATTERWTGNNGEKNSQTEWHNVSIFGKAVDFIEKYVDKGSQVFIEGKIRTRSYTDQHGEQKYITEIISQSLQMLGGKKNDSSNEEDDMPY